MANKIEALTDKRRFYFAPPEAKMRERLPVQWA